jgi:hypothetical protein
MRIQLRAAEVVPSEATIALVQAAVISPAAFHHA